ncbi:murein DD-endopeptidase MepM/ murein hydrolase activator NlpD [Cytobacillus eiseniae]|uniref:Murein DD-endopeptidase MepM/ murein hydrolase activator NlpD n=1 Tax=Cytobacillus eiseniae TaxID=762947 RepID=A0ABS4RIV1_9BACI|nr:M23 family metallopeptidase [Cytobacillus eiseniae]MBP2242659.1 murein DD-endopeptidase MepM/ murein hydrolase activator NlpD [Cytobacillus eiseniae]
MQESIKKLIEMKNNTYNRWTKIVKKTAITALAVAAISFTGSSAAFANGEKLMTVYYVYVNDEYIGTVSDKKMIEDQVNAKLGESKATYKDMNLSIAAEISYVPEQVFHLNAANNAEVAKEVVNEISIKADAYAIVIEGKPVAYVETADQAKDVIQKLKSKYVSEAELQTLEAQKEDQSTLPPLKENESRILDVRLSKEVTVSNEKIEPAKMMSVEDTIKLLEKGSVEEVKYKVKEGDVLGGIAHAHNLDVEQLLSINPGLTEETLLQIDQELNVTVLKPYVQVIVDKEKYVKENVAFEKEVVEDSSMFKGDTKVKQEGKDGIREATYRISEQNGQAIAKELTKENILQEPVKHIVIKGTKVIPSRGDGSFIWPANGGYVSSKVGHRWGRMHKGIDIARPSNRTIKAADNGVVVSAGYDGSFGNKVVIDHKNGYRTLYAHLSSITVSVGQTISKGSKIGVMGSTGNSTGVHLHFEIHKNGKIQNPLNYIR